MKPSRFTEEQIIGILREQEAGAATAEVCRKHGISSASFYKWKAKYGGLEISDAKRLKGPLFRSVCVDRVAGLASLGGQPRATIAAELHAATLRSRERGFRALGDHALTKTKGRRYCSPMSRNELSGDDERDCDARHLSQPHQPVNAALPRVLCVHRISPDSLSGESFHGVGHRKVNAARSNHGIVAEH
jgi:putative transposase